MGLFSSKEDKEIIQQLSMQIEKQQESVVKLSRENEELRKQYELAEINKHIETERLFKEKEKLENDIKKLNALQYKSSKKCIQAVTINGNEKGNLLECGIYKSGEDFTPGKYDFYAIEGKGDISCSKGDIWEHMSEKPEENYIKKYRNMYIPNGSKIEINGNLKLLMYHSMPIEPKFREENDESVISTGQYKIGEDIPAGKYIIELKSGKGIIDDSDEICVEFGKCEITRASVVLKKGKILAVDGNLEVYIYESKPIHITKKERDINNNSVLCGGVYDAGIDIPFGYYDIILVKGKGSFELETTNENHSRFYENFSEKDIKEYRNLLVGIGDRITVENGLEVSLLFTKSYSDVEISQNILREIRDVRSELSVLNNQLIEKYYMFSDYSAISSEECKNKLMLLKQEEKEIRNSGEDIIISDLKDDVKFKERLIRQIIRTFNAECDNITLNVSLNNIDWSRKNIQQSFETLNKLYAVYGVQLSRTLLKLKFEQATLMYTYELKYQQEKDIQRAIKEQMLDEAKAQREIEEQKKKIEKDLQQHLGEVNRLMKYLQKTQIDAEKQLYINKIKELEEKIKVLESDKQTVLEREANAKAGFVYIISNIGSFGENIYKIGMTRRLEPMDRINELSSASVPFEFDVHAMIFSSDAPELENTLHKHFADKAVNKVNPRKEFYNVDIDEIEKIVKENYNDTVRFTKVPIAREYRQSLNFQGLEA